MDVIVGTCGLPKRIEALAHTLGGCEIQETFYRIVDGKRLHSWSSKVRGINPNFVLCAKAPQYITHPSTSPTYRRSNIRPEEVGEVGFFSSSSGVMGLWNRLYQDLKRWGYRAVVFQSPASYLKHDPAMERASTFFQHLKGGIEYYWEARGLERKPDLIDQYKGVLEQCGIGAAFDPFSHTSHLKDMVPCGCGAYLRLHGSPPGKRMYKYTYSDADLEHLLTTAGMLEASGCTHIYVMFNNFTMYEDAGRFRRIISSAYR